MWTNEEVTVELISTDEEYEIPNFTWKLDDEDIGTGNAENNTISITLNKQQFPETKHKIFIYDEDDKKIGKLVLRFYDPPIVKFDRPNNTQYAGRFFFDRGEVPSLQDYGSYETLQFPWTDEEYYIPVLGLNKNQSANIKVSIENFPNYAKDDRNFKLQIVPNQLEKIFFNNTDDELEYNAEQLADLNEIDIRAEKIIGDESLLINAYIPSIDQTVGAIEYYCKEKVSKEIKLVYVKCADETDYPELPLSELETYLNTNSLNQLFLNISVIISQLTSNYNKSFFEGKDKEFILSVFIHEKYDQAFPIPTTESSDDVYFVSNIQGGTDPAGHLRGQKGGIQLKLSPNTILSKYEVVAHELGHWLGFPEIFNDDGDSPFTFKIHESQGQSDYNFMDYDVTVRNSWYKIQLLNMKLNHDDDE
ncbi:hypothetical protein L21SP5_00252 [Salinivirga cyanobacteriivorans]|uniref:Uncharacterized protein n=2 Tax=Salinivirga cyanobacteriivorans TaxID=1307839 RepID=A0A0S2HVG2_9BACT|nr:hypothetical protein L21SP5_00155 [Salinivirga cyanobacteriivorans]ALO13932.1 hypothetical protein L21SP5_00252 [Salinivirga cyanobacteriivorans]